MYSKLRTKIHLKAPWHEILFFFKLVKNGVNSAKTLRFYMYNPHIWENLCQTLFFILFYAVCLALISNSICCTLRSGLHEIPTMMTFPHGLKNNHACKWTSDNFQECFQMYYSWKIVKKPFSCMVILHVHVDRSVRVTNLWDKYVPYF